MFVFFYPFPVLLFPIYSRLLPSCGVGKMRKKCDNSYAKEKEVIFIPYYPYFGQNPYQFGAYGSAPTSPASPAPQATAQPGTLLGRMVTSREEAVAVPADFQGNPIVMPDFAHGKIYVKFFNTNDGTASVVDFTAPQAAKPSAPQYATMDDIAQLRAEISALRGCEEKEANG